VRLSLGTLARVPAVVRPRLDPRELRVGIVHLGIGAFHRAHQAVFTEDAGDGWGICGVSQRSRTVIDELAPQDGLYTVLVRWATQVEARVVGAVRELRFADASRIADPAVRVVTLTVTEKGYRHDPATGRLRLDDEGIRADLAGGAPRTVVGQLARGLAARMHAGAGPVAVVSCDNLAHNGRTLAGLIGEFVAALPDGPLGEWIAAQVSFPSTVVDRIVPATTPADRADARRLIGLDDFGTVVTEPFKQWVIEDDFPGGRPAWERAGALLTADVTPFEVIKLRMLNGAHSALAYLGALAGCETIAEAMARFGEVARSLMSDDVVPTLNVPAGFDIGAYQQQLLDRFANPALRHRTVQVAMDGSQKLPQRLLPTVRARRAAGAEPRWATLAIAAWMRWVCVAPELDDPMAGRLRATVAGASPEQVVDRLLAITEIFGDDLREDAVVRGLLVDGLHWITVSVEGAA
jgi:fructuronate reductase